MASKNPHLTVVVSVYNEEEALPDFKNELVGVLKELSIYSEVIWVNDGSKDASEELINSFRFNSNETVLHKTISFSTNFGHEAAMIAGIDHAEGDFIICMDADLQHPPAKIQSMLEETNQGVDIVTMVRDSNREKSKTTNSLSSLFYPIFNRLSDYKFEENASDFFLISKRVAEVLRTTYRERNRFLRGYIQVMGFNKTTLTYHAQERHSGDSKYNLRSLFKLAIAAISSFSKKPLYVALGAAATFSILSLLLAFYSIYMYFFGENPPSGYTTLVVFMSICFTIVYVILAIISIYIGFSFDEVKDRPIYLIKDSKINTSKDV